MIAHQLGCQRRPHVARLTIAVKEDYGRPLAADAHVDRGAISRDFLYAEGPGERMHLRHGRRRSQNRAEHDRD